MGSKVRWRRVSFAIALGCALLAGFSIEARADQAQSFHAKGSARQLTGAPGIYEWSYGAKVGPSPYDQIGLHHVAKGPVPAAQPKIVLLYLPGTNMNGEIAVEDPRYSFPVYMAVHDVDVWTLDYRTHFVPPTTDAKDLAPVMQGWTNEAFASDIEDAARFIMQQTGAAKIDVAGFSRGVTFAYLFAALHPQQTAGVIALDGFIPDHPSTAAPPERLVDDIGGAHLTYDKRRTLMQMVIDNP
ncbi:MAG TPA: alpha/beta hydrolase, partial [Candidatus Binataceae bacterium]|nr:alpha/beta hydrolase [Candidatus Binataceae bacterium]